MANSRLRNELAANSRSEMKNSDEIGLVGEKLYKVHTYATSKDLKKYLDEVVDFVRIIKEELKQEAMAMEINQKLTLI